MKEASFQKVKTEGFLVQIARRLKLIQMYGDTTSCQIGPRAMTVNLCGKSLLKRTIRNL